MKDKKFEKRKQQLLKAIEENPKDLENHLILAKFYYLNECFQESIEVYQKLLQYYPKNVSVLFNLAVAYQAANELEKAKETYIKILKIDPNHKGALSGLDKLTTFK